MSKSYYTVCVRNTSKSPFGPEFGDYDKEVALEEAQNLVEEYGRKNVRTIRTWDHQSAIDAGVKELNEKEAAKV
jgi:hypothetical protein